MRIQVESRLGELNELKREYIRSTTAPLDGMWLSGFIPAAAHYGIYSGAALVGYFCVDADGFLLQFHVTEECENAAAEFFASIVAGNESPAGRLKGAFVSTAEPGYLSHCLDGFRTFEVNALMYELRTLVPPDCDGQAPPLASIAAEQLPRVVDFAVASIGAPADWLNTYYANLIARGEVFGVWEGESLLATGEVRGYDALQTEYCDLGVVVGTAHRGRGLATHVLRSLVGIGRDRGLRPICSTERSNLAAQKAIGRAGFHSRNRIVQFRA